jgi:hypothetical protein
MIKFIEKISLTCDCGNTFTAFFSTTLTKKGAVLSRERTNNLNGDLCAKCNIKNGLRKGN